MFLDAAIRNVLIFLLLVMKVYDELRKKYLESNKTYVPTGVPLEIRFV